jgi:hypothetical protein
LLNKIIIFLFVFFFEVYSSQKADIFLKKGEYMNNLYPVLFANWEQNNYCPANVKTKLKMSWQKLRPKNELGQSGYILASSDMIYLVSSYQITAFNNIGKQKWTCEKWINSPVSLYKDFVYCISDDIDKIKIINKITGKTDKKEPTMSLIEPKHNILLFYPQSDFYISCIQQPSIQELNEKGEPQTYSPMYSIFSSDYYPKTWGFKWGVDKKEQITFPVILLSQNNYILIGTKNEITVYKTKKEDSSSIFHKYKYPLEKITRFCSDNNNNICFLGSDKQSQYLALCDLKGNILWKWEHKKISEESAFIAAGENNEIYVADESNLYCIKDGKELWSFDTKSEKPTFITATLEGNIILIAEDMVFLIKQGKLIASFDAKAKIISPAVVDIYGAIYLLTYTHIIKLE